MKWVFNKPCASLLLAISFCRLYSMPQAAASTTIQRIAQVRQDIERIKVKIQNIAQRMEDDGNPINTVVLAFGHTREGKSTLLNLLANRRLVVNTTFGVSSVSVPNPVDGMEVGHTAQSVTDEPHHWYDPYRRILYFDCPGIADSDAVNELKNTYSMRELFSAFERIKILLVISEDAIRTTSSVVLKTTVRSLAEMFGNDIQLVSDALCLVVTKQNRWTNPADVVGYINAGLLAGLRNQLPNPLPMPLPARIVSEQKNIELLEGICRAPLIFLPEATGAGPFLPLIDAVDPAQITRGARIVREIIDALMNDCQEISGHVPEPSASAEARNLAREFAEEISAEILAFIEDDLVPKLITFGKGLIPQKNTALEARTAFANLQTIIDLMNRGTVDDFIDGLQQVLDTFEIDYDDDLEEYSIVKNIRLILFLQTVNPRITVDLDDWFEPIGQVSEMFNAMSVAPQPSLSSHNILTLKGVFLGLADIVNGYNQHQRATQIHAYATNTLFCDANLTCPSISLVLIAPYWKIFSNKTISLKGLDGQNGVVNPVANDGLDGNPGAHGHHGGHFYGKGKLFNDLARLTVDTSGGRGGNGSNGNNGAPGSVGANASLTTGTEGQRVPYYAGFGDINVVLRPGSSEFFGRLYAYIGHDIAKNQIRISYVPVSYDNSGSTGGNGQANGRGGKGGDSGAAGQIVMSGGALTNGQTASHVGVTDGHSGTPGAGGAGGFGSTGETWKNLIVWDDEWKDSWAVPFHVNTGTRWECVIDGHAMAVAMMPGGIGMKKFAAIYLSDLTSTLANFVSRASGSIVKTAATQTTVRAASGNPGQTLTQLISLPPIASLPSLVTVSHDTAYASWAQNEQNGPLGAFSESIT